MLCMQEPGQGSRGFGIGQESASSISATELFFASWQQPMTGGGSNSPPKSIHLLSGGIAGFFECTCCHPLDTIKVRMQLGGDFSKLGPISTWLRIVRGEGVFALYKGYGAVVPAIIPKMALRFAAFEAYRDQLKKVYNSSRTATVNFVAGLGAGITEAVVVVNPSEVVKIRLQAQKRLSPPAGSGGVAASYHGAFHALRSIVANEGIGALYRGVLLTAARQATNQAANFTVYNELKRLVGGSEKSIAPPVHLLIGFISGAVGPIVNAPLDAVKTRIQRQIATRSSGPGGEASQIRETFLQVYRKEGIGAFYSGLTPRILRVATGQAIVFFVYERASRLLQQVFNKDQK